MSIPFKINKYFILNTIGSGMFSTIYLSYNKSNFYALKIIEYKNGLKEIDKLKDINKDANKNNCIYYIEYFKWNDKLIIIYPYLFMSLDQILNKYYPKGMPENIVLKIYNDIKKSLLFIHSKNILHADIKPDNICVKLNVLSNNLNDDNLKIINRINKSKNKNNILQKIYNENFKKEDTDDEMVDDDINTDSDIDSSNEDDYELIFEYKGKSIKKNDTNQENDTDTNQDNNQIINQNSINNYDNIFLNSTYYLCDFGNSFKINNENYFLDYNTRYYRSPEIIFRCNHTLKSDYWAFGCSLCEILYNKILFNPLKIDNTTTDIIHLSLFISCFNDQNINNELLIQGRKYNYFFDGNNRLKTNKIITNFENKNMVYNNSEIMNNIIINLLQLNYENRRLI